MHGQPHMQNTYNLFNTPVNQRSISFTEVNEIADGCVNMARHSSKCVCSLSPCSARYIGELNTDSTGPIFQRTAIIILILTL